ncbi:MAG: ATP-binding protein, partial [Geminicoccales bacterium]
IADIAHELRTPLAVLRGEIEALQDGVRPLGRDALDSLAGDTARLSRLVEDLHTLSLSDLGALSYHKEPVDLAEVANEVLDERRVRTKGLKLEKDLQPAPLMGDADRLGQVFSNLLENSLRYTDPPGQIRVSSGNGFVLWEDSSPGVPEADLPKLTGRLYRVEGSRSRNGGGSGLGLAIARAIVEAHGGTLAASASLLGGLRIELRFGSG